MALARYVMALVLQLLKKNAQKTFLHIFTLDHKIKLDQQDVLKRTIT